MSKRFVLKTFRADLEHKNRSRLFLISPLQKAALKAPDREYFGVRGRLSLHRSKKPRPHRYAKRCGLVSGFVSR